MQRSFSGTESMTEEMCLPQPHQVALPVCKHIISLCSSRSKEWISVTRTTCRAIGLQTHGGSCFAILTSIMRVQKSELAGDHYVIVMTTTCEFGIR